MQKIEDKEVTDMWVTIFSQRVEEWSDEARKEFLRNLEEFLDGLKQMSTEESRRMRGS